MRTVLALIIVFAMTLPTFAQPDNLNLLHAKTEGRLKEIVRNTSGVMGLYALDLKSGEKFALNADLVFPQASAIKIAILMEVFKQAHAGKFKLTDRKHILKKDKAGGSGILIELGDGTVELSIRDLCVLMMLLSDNTATNILIDLVGKNTINSTMSSLGLKETKVQRRMMDTAASHRGDENISTPAEAGRIMEILYKGEFINPEVSWEILSILTKLRETKLKNGLPPDVTVATKPGGIAGVSTEWAVVMLKDRPYIVVVMENYGSRDTAETFKQISQILFDHFSRLAKATPYGALVDKPAKAGK